MEMCKFNGMLITEVTVNRGDVKDYIIFRSVSIACPSHLYPLAGWVYQKHFYVMHPSSKPSLIMCL